jgi:hypothetical protein
MIYSQIKVKDVEITRPKQLKKDLLELKNPLLRFLPKNYSPRRLNTLRIRIFPFSKKENCNEFYIRQKNKKYLCLNSCLLSRRYYSALQYTLHGIAHSFCFLRHDISEEVFCEYVSYSILNEFLKDKGEKFRRRIIRSIMKISGRDYNNYYRAARKLDKKNKDFLKKLNSKAKNKKLSKRKEKRVFSRLLKMRRIDDNDLTDNSLELEKGFRKL